MRLGSINLYLCYMNVTLLDDDKNCNDRKFMANIIELLLYARHYELYIRCLIKFSQLSDADNIFSNWLIDNQ